MDTTWSYFTPRVLPLADGAVYDFNLVKNGTQKPKTNLGAPLRFEGGAFTILSYLAAGSSAYVFIGKMVDLKQTNGAEIYVAYKVSNKSTKTLRMTPLWSEAALSASIAAYNAPEFSMSKYVSGVAGAFFSDFGNPGQLRTVIVFELMTASLNDLYKYVPQLLQYLMAIFNMAIDIAYLHSYGITHNDVKPENFLMKWDQGVRKPPNIKVADLGFGCRSCDPIYRSFEAYQYPRSPNNVYSKMVPKTDDPKLGACTYGLSPFYSSPWYIKKRARVDAYDMGMYEDYAVAAATRMVQELSAGITIDPNYQQVMKAAALKHFESISQCGEYGMRVMNDLHCLAMSFIRMAVYISLDDPGAAILNDTRTVKWLVQITRTNQESMREVWRTNRMEFAHETIPGTPARLRRSLANLTLVLFKTLQEISNITITDIIDAISETLGDLIATAPPELKEEAEAYRRVPMEQYFGNTVASSVSKKRGTPTQQQDGDDMEFDEKSQGGKKKRVLGPTQQHFMEYDDKNVIPTGEEAEAL